jgi:hypothetical protein
MKAFNQIDMSTEKRVLLSYASILSILSFFILLSPLFGQERDTLHNKPEVCIDIKKDFDEDGNLTGYDSSYSWFWSGKDLIPVDVDSLIRHFRKHSGGFGFLWSEDPFRFYPITPDSLWSRYKNFDQPDSSRYSYLDEFFNDDFFERFDLFIPPYPYYHRWDYHKDDSLGISYFDNEYWDRFFDEHLNREGLNEKLQEQQRNFEERYEKYLEEHRKLIEKYFNTPYQEDDQTPEMKKKPPSNSKGTSGKI